ncbi:DoxX family protein [Pelagibius litoralis]|uniref:DoxX family protein n=1 Tax=Pelagibius litoralis TaxID=374515 RepID=A0A967EVF1_9PROT|nr:DoxX family protein [Pelagibius litoralis]NIA68417.1 DoxX family protein [Pelagibius litoralis]
MTQLTALYDRIFGLIEAKLDGWFLGFLARLVFAAVLAVYYLHSASLKVGDGVTGFFSVGDNAYFQILPSVVEAYGYDASQVPFFPYDLIVFAGTYAEFVLPLLIVFGLFTRLASLGMIGFIVVQSYVDIAFHGVDAATVGSWFDRLPSAAILDQRALWVFLLIALVVKGAGALSLDHVLGRVVRVKQPPRPVTA